VKHPELIKEYENLAYAPCLTEARRRMLDLFEIVSSSHERAAGELLESYSGLPANLPVLQMMRPPGGNSRPEGIAESYYEGCVVADCCRRTDARGHQAAERPAGNPEKDSLPILPTERPALPLRHLAVRVQSRFQFAVSQSAVSRRLSRKREKRDDRPLLSRSNAPFVTRRAHHP
jgi:hypothetical protein